MYLQAKDLRDRVALVTGASRGIGRAIALSLAAQGCQVAICGRDETSLSNVEQEISGLGANCLKAVCDVASEQQILQMLSTIRASFGEIHILINNAGIYRTEAVASQDTASWNELLQINLTSALILSREVLPAMKESQWGRIINISSVSGKTGEIWGAAYSASKFGMIGLTQSTALEVAADGITVNAVCPGWVRTELAEKQLTDPEYCKLTSVPVEDAKMLAISAVPQMRFIETNEVAELVVFLCSDAAKGITGQSINICGGLTLH